MKRIHHTPLWLLLAALLASGCASGAKMQRMIPSDLARTGAQTGQTLDVRSVRGGEKTDPLWKSKIASEDFGAALVEALRASGLFTSVGDRASDLALDVHLIYQDQPNVGLGLTVDLRVRYVVTDRGSGDVVLDEMVDSSYRAGMGEGLAAVTRLRKANEGAARENIRQFIHRLAAADLASR